MRENVGHTDRLVRSILGPVLIVRGLGQLLMGKRRGVFGIIAGTLVVESAVTRVCPLSAALGIDTRSTNERMSDFRADVSEQTERIEHEYGTLETPEEFGGAEAIGAVEPADQSAPIGMNEAPISRT